MKGPFGPIGTMRGGREFDGGKSTSQICVSTAAHGVTAVWNALKSCFPLRSGRYSHLVMSYASLNFLTWLTWPKSPIVRDFDGEKYEVAPLLQS